MNKYISLTEHAHLIINQSLNSGDIVIDATVGNGYDTLFLAKQVGDQGTVFGFDSQHQAITSTRSRLESKNMIKNTRLIHACHSEMAKHIAVKFHQKIKLIMFNLGYLPGSDKTVITHADSTLKALNQSVLLLSTTGIITIIAYPGHMGGEIETNQIDLWSKQLNHEQYNRKTLYCSEKTSAPRLFIINKITQT